MHPASPGEGGRAAADREGLRHGREGRALYEELRRSEVVEYDEGGAIGRRYRRQDEIGTPFAFTID